MLALYKDSPPFLVAGTVARRIYYEYQIEYSRIHTAMLNSVDMLTTDIIKKIIKKITKTCDNYDATFI